MKNMHFIIQMTFFEPKKETDVQLYTQQNSTLKTILEILQTSLCVQTVTERY